MVLISAIKLTINLITRSTCTWHSTFSFSCIGASTLNHKVRNHSVPLQTIVITIFGKLNKVGYRIRRIIRIKFNFHVSFARLNNCVHSRCFLMEQMYIFFSKIKTLLKTSLKTLQKSFKIEDTDLLNLVKQDFKWVCLAH